MVFSLKTSVLALKIVEKRRFSTVFNEELDFFVAFD